MADKRINALANTASSTASDDFIAVDGTTNGTRKLNAFSPTFGGNATVTGTLTVNGSGTYGSINMPSATTLGAGLAFGTDITIYRNFANQLSTTAYALTGGVSGAGYFSIIASGSSVLTFNNGNGESFRVGASRGVNIGDTADVAAGSLKVSGTTASTSTSTGALVVGNGTSGGLGVGGAASIGGPILVGTSSDVYLSRVGTGILDIRSASSPGTAARLDITGTTSAGVGFRQSGSRDWFISAESNELRVSCLTAASIFAFNSGTPVAMRDTTASTSTSSGALVVSGGVGVAGAVFTGGYVHPGGDSTFYIRGTGSNNGLIRGNVTSVDVDTSFGVRNGDGSSTYLSVASTGLIAAIPATAPSLTVNGTMTFERTSNTSLKISVRGTDGTTRSVSLTLA